MGSRILSASLNPSRISEYMSTISLYVDNVDILLANILPYGPIRAMTLTGEE